MQNIILKTFLSANPETKTDFIIEFCWRWHDLICTTLKDTNHCEEMKKTAMREKARLTARPTIQGKYPSDGLRCGGDNPAGTHSMDGCLIKEV